MQACTGLLTTLRPALSALLTQHRVADANGQSPKECASGSQRAGQVACVHAALRLLAWRSRDHALMDSRTHCCCAMLGPCGAQGSKAPSDALMAACTRGWAPLVRALLAQHADLAQRAKQQARRMRMLGLKVCTAALAQWGIVRRRCMLPSILAACVGVAGKGIDSIFENGGLMHACMRRWLHAGRHHAAAGGMHARPQRGGHGAAVQRRRCQRFPSGVCTAATRHPPLQGCIIGS